ncbi:MAG: GHMP kinase, partial [Armatimonadota bacterium]
IDAQVETLDRIKAQASEVFETLTDGILNRVGRVLDAGWQHKRQLAGKITNGEIDEMYDRALDAGATGGKIAGAGGGGFLLLYCPPDRQARLREAMKGLKELPFSLERDGTKVIFNARR